MDDCYRDRLTSFNKDWVGVEDSSCKVYIWEGDSANDPQCQTVNNVKIVSLGGLHRALLTTDGKLFTCGDNKHGQLGIESVSTFVSTPVFVPVEDVVTDVSCGEMHTACVTQSGHVYCWGDNTWFQCAVDQVKIVRNPRNVPVVQASCSNAVNPNLSRDGSTAAGENTSNNNRFSASLEQSQQIKFIKVSCGSRHTIALSEDGKLWAWGSGYQLGLGDCGVSSQPQLVELPADRHVIAVSCGSDHTVALVVRQNDININSDHSKQKNSKISTVRTKSSPSQHETHADDELVSRGHVVNKDKVESLSDFQLLRQQHPLVQNCEMEMQELFATGSCDYSVPELTDSVEYSASTSFAEDINKRSFGDQGKGRLLADDSNCSLSVKSSSFVTADHDVDHLNSVLTATQFPDSSNTCKSKSSGAIAEEQEIALANLPKSRSTFLDETEAKEFLQRRLSDFETSDSEKAIADDGKQLMTPPSEHILDKKDAADSVPSTSPFVRTVGTLLQHVPSSPVIVQEYVTNLTRSVVSNLRTSMDRRFNFVTSQVEMSIGGFVPIGKASDTEVTNCNAILDDNTLLEHVAVTAADLSHCNGLIGKSSTTDFEPQPRATHHRNSSLPVGAIELAYAARLDSGECDGDGREWQTESSVEMRMWQMGSLVNLAYFCWCCVQRYFVISKQSEKICLETEVWSWGCGKSGQLGHADFLDRGLPCQISSLDDCQIVKVSAGGQHTVALSAACQVLTWGDNSHGQLGHAHPGTSTPYSINLHGKMPSWDIAAGNSHTVILTDGLTSEPHVYSAGSSLPTASSIASQFCLLGKLKSLGTVSDVFAGGINQTACISHQQQPVTLLLCELAASERLFHVTVDKIDRLFVQPLLQLERASSQPVSIQHSLQPIANELKLICHLSAELHLHLANLLRDTPTSQLANVLLVYLFRDNDGRLAAFQRYASVFADSCVSGAFDKSIQSYRGFFDKVKSEFAEILEESKINVNNVGETFENLLQFPLIRPREYQKSICKLSLLYSAYSKEHIRLNKLSQNWQALKQTIRLELELVKRTIDYWRTGPVKVVEALQTAERRLVRDSKKHPMSLSTAGRFSPAHNFLLFNDCFVHVQNSIPQVYPLCTLWVEILPDTKQLKNAIQLIMPEESLSVTTPSHSDKAEWIWCLNQTISRALVADRQQNPLSPVHGTAAHADDNSSNSVVRLLPLAPPSDRHFSYTFLKPGPLKDAQYKGMWRIGKIHGHGQLVWPDCRRYCGQFVDGQFEGYGVYTQPTDDLGVEISEGLWKAGLLHGQARVRYSNGDMYNGEFFDGKKQGHGVLKQGKFTASLANIYIGQWQSDKRHGYGVCDDIPKGQKYMGMWVDDNRHGNGVIVTLDGLYFEGNFIGGKVAGNGLLITEDGCCFEGEFSAGPSLCGKGTLTLPNEDYIEGQFNGSFNEGIKVNGTYRKPDSLSSCSTPKLPVTYGTSVTLPKRYGQLSVCATRKWEELFTRCKIQMLGPQVVVNAIGDNELQSSIQQSQKVWRNVAACLNNASSFTVRAQRKAADVNFDDLCKIPDMITSILTLERYADIKLYLAKAVEVNTHPLGQLVNSLVDVFLSTYVGVGSHLRLLHHAVNELKSFVSRMYQLVRLMFPSLPPEQKPLRCVSERDAVADYDHDDSAYDNNSEVVTAASLLYVFLLPKIYPPLFNLYALYNEKDDDRYWKRIRLWNKQSNVALMSYLGVDRKFWLSATDSNTTDVAQTEVTRRDDMYSEAIDRLQRISTSFCPSEKLSQIQLAFDEINKVVQQHLGCEYQWCMDDLFPVFQYIVVRSRIQHLAAEIHFIDDLMEPHLQHGELGIMFTTLKACYYQILNEKVV